MVRASQKDAYEAYYLCRLKEVTEKTPTQLPRLTTAQATLGSRRRLSGEDLDLQGSARLSISEKRKSSARTSVRRPSASIASMESAYKEALAHWTGGEAAGNREDAKPTSKTGAKANEPRRSLSTPTLTSRRSTPSLPALTAPELETFPIPEEADEDVEEEALIGEEARAFEVITGARFFKDLDRELLRPVVKDMSFTHQPDGVVLFRQGDPPTNCYIIMSGTCTFYAGSTSKSPRKPCTEGHENDRVPPDRKSRVNTFEQWSTFATDSNLGRMVHKAQAGDVFGELALMDETEVRKASAKCNSDCELLCVPTAAFETVRKHIREVEQRKRNFLGKCVPGLKEIPEPLPGEPPHPAFYFQPLAVNEGHIFCRQGIMEEPVFYVVRRGSVKFCLAQENSLGTKCQATCDILQQGGIFGSLPHSVKEPFSIIANSTPCEVFVVPGHQFESFPEAVLQGVLAKISAEAAKRLRKCCVTQRMGWEQQKIYTKNHRPKDDVAAELLSLPSRELRARMLQG